MKCQRTQQNPGLMIFFKILKFFEFDMASQMQCAVENTGKTLRHISYGFSKFSFAITGINCILKYIHIKIY